MCTYRFDPSLFATIGDEIKVVIDSSENVGIGYAIGVNYSKAAGGRIQDPDGKRISVEYPNSLWLSVFNTGEVGNYKITHYYLQQSKTTTKLENQSNLAFSIEDREQKQDKLYQWSLVIGAILLLALIIGCYFVYRKFKKERQMH